MDSSDFNRRLTDLEAILGEYMAQSALAARRAEIAQAQRDKEMQAFREEMQTLKEAVRVLQDEMLTLKDGMLTLKDGVQVFEKETREVIKNLNKKWGELSNRLGTIVEDIVAPNLPAVADRYFGLKKIDRMLLNVYASSSKPDGVGREFDAILVSGDTVLLNETKATVRQHHIEDFAEVLPEFFDYFPEYKGKKLIPIFSSLSLNPSQVAFLTKRNIYAMAMSGNTMDILNFNDVHRNGQT
ncbi:MAG: hypothetical protein RMI34_00795 [Chloroherpetonaceae bacterium]|nr:hypothetical protein [Chloroherpetonaceae bacterium]MCS7211816.1 hypothetical protein [Chloroherpetonaceae bacterium]MDW8018597.1 hypothetical protein [Chloroherpetonaceae bacterium]MDW8467299.1 hypothetical protein [Chloroherpetonaceae bacterium]